jgi:hypothetical protein
VILVPAGILLVIKMIPKEVMDDCRKKAEKLKPGSTEGIIAMVVIIGIWLMALTWLIRLFIHVKT